MPSDAEHAALDAFLGIAFLRVPAAIAAIGVDGRIIRCNPAYCEIVDVEMDELLGADAAAFVHPDDVDRAISASLVRMEADRRAGTQPDPIRMVRRDGTIVWVRFDSLLVDDGCTEPYVLATMADVSLQVESEAAAREAEAAAREAEARFRSAFATSPLGIGFAEIDGRLTWVNQALADIVGVPEQELLERSFQDFSSVEDLAREQHATRRLLRGEIDSFCTEKRYEHPDGRTVWTLLHVSLVRNAAGAPAHLLGQLEDVTERKQRELSLTHDAVHDPLTGLLNRAGLRDRVDAAWVVRRAEAPLAVLFGDLDGFKHVNDTLGHDAGDEVLVHVAERLQGAVRAGDVVARWGGDEFVILCPSVAGVADAVCVADRIRVALEVPFRIGPGEARIGISIGLALDTGQPLPDLVIKDADAAAYQAKLAGRNRVVRAAESRA